MLSKISSKQQYAPQSDESTLWSLDLHDLWRDDVSSVNFLNRPASNHKKTDSYENTRSLAWNWFDVPLIVAWLRICSSHIMQHIQVFVNSQSSLGELSCFLMDLRCRLGPFRTRSSTILSRWMTPPHFFTMQASKIFVFAFCSLFGCEFGNCLNYNLAIFTCTAITVDVASENRLAQSDLLNLLRLPMRRQTSQAHKKTTERFLNFKCNHCGSEFATLRSYTGHRVHPKARGTLCSEESSKSETTFAERADLATGILRQHSLAKAKLGTCSHFFK